MLRVILVLLTLLCCLVGVPADPPGTTAAASDEGVMVALRPFAEWLSATVQSNVARHEIIITAHGQTVTFTTDSKHALVNGTPVTLPLPVVEQQGITMVSLPFLASAFHATLTWDAHKTMATVTHPDIKKPLVIPIAIPVPKLLIDFIHAIRSGDLAATRKMITAHPKLLNTPDENGDTPLFLAAMNGHTAIVKLLLDHHANIRATNGQKQTALHLAALGGSTDCVNALLAAGASSQINAADTGGMTPLMNAAGSAHAPLVKLLLDHHANIGAVNGQKQTVLQLAALGGSADCVNAVLAAGASSQVNAADVNGDTPLFYAAELGHAAIVKLLLDHHASIHTTNHQKQAVLHMAVKGGNADCVRYLLAEGASPSARDLNDDLPLHYVAITNHVAMARLLLAHKIGLNAKDHDGDTPLRCAIKAKQKEMAAFLRGMGGHE